MTTYDFNLAVIDYKKKFGKHADLNSVTAGDKLRDEISAKMLEAINRGSPRTESEEDALDWTPAMMLFFNDSPQRSPEKFDTGDVMMMS